MVFLLVGFVSFHSLANACVHCDSEIVIYKKEHNCFFRQLDGLIEISAEAGFALFDFGSCDRKLKDSNVRVLRNPTVPMPEVNESQFLRVYILSNSSLVCLRGISSKLQYPSNGALNIDLEKCES